MTKKEAISVFERAGYKFIGFNDIGWGEKFYVFENPDTEEFTGNAYSTFTLKSMRKKAEQLGWVMWSKAVQEELRQGIQMELFCNWEIEEMSVA